MDIIDIREQLPRANAGNVEYRTLGEIDHGAWHYDEVYAPEEYDPVRRYAAQARYHINRNWGTAQRPAYGFGLMYHYKVARDGRVYRCQDETMVTWSVRDGNRRTLSICADLGRGQEPSRVQLDALVALSDWLSHERPDLPNLHRRDWWGHGELTQWGNATECPGLLLPHVRAYREGVVPPRPRTVLFRETGQTVSGAFLDFWESLGERALALFGYPISREMLQRLEDGNLHRVQYFERGRFEMHGEQVVLGRLGAEVYARLRVEGAG